MEELEENARHACMTVDPEIKQKWLTLPQLNTQYVEQTIKSIKYKERLSEYGIFPDPSYDESEIYSSEEDQ